MTADLAGSVTIESKNDLIDLLHVDTAHAKATLSLWGGQVLSFIPTSDARERLFMSEQAIFDGSKSIRGGVPICWPWFGAHESGLQSHGFIRHRPWKLSSSHETADYTELVITPESTQGEGFEGRCALSLTVRVAECLTLTLTTQNTGDSAFQYHAALHSYFAVDDIHHTTLQGLSGPYLDKTRDWDLLDTPNPYVFQEETDRIHLNPVKQVSIVEHGRQTHVESYGHDSVVVWNPWSEVASELRDMSATGYQKMLCVETAVTEGMEVLPGGFHSITQVIR